MSDLLHTLRAVLPPGWSVEAAGEGLVVSSRSRRLRVSGLDVVRERRERGRWRRTETHEVSGLHRLEEVALRHLRMMVGGRQGRLV